MIVVNSGLQMYLKSKYLTRSLARVSPVEKLFRLPSSCRRIVDDKNIFMSLINRT